ncbi:MAG: TrbC/VirB2 family protein [Bdellovibrio sp.]|uniref:TrbC/VirB2 family protein n=1 Tax=Bdellovibrio sp. TaxID=28201 RepID=UPI0039E68741|nr:TrbC/VirB2 family protein [Bdellovibrio sp.]
MRQAKVLLSEGSKATLGCALLLLLTFSLVPLLAQASVESSLLGVQTKLTRVILPVLSVIGIALAGLSFITGNENAKKHIIYAIIGTAIGFGAQSIADLISQTVR